MAPPADDGRPAALPPLPRLIQRYEAIAAASHAMLAAAQADRWDEVARLEAHCCDLIAQLKQAAASERLDPQEQRRRIELLREILADDAQIRQRSEPWLQQLEGMIGDSAARLRRSTRR